MIATSGFSKLWSRLPLSRSRVFGECMKRLGKRITETEVCFNMTPAMSNLKVKTSLQCLLSHFSPLKFGKCLILGQEGGTGDKFLKL